MGYLAWRHISAIGMLENRSLSVGDLSGEIELRTKIITIKPVEL